MKLGRIRGLSLQIRKVLSECVSWQYYEYREDTETALEVMASFV